MAKKLKLESSAVFDSKRSSQFDQAYYQKYYVDERTRAVSDEEQRRQAQFIAAYLQYLEVPVTSIVDIGCGLGVLLTHISERFPTAKSLGVEFSEYLCAELGWTQGSVVNFKAKPFDLVVCSDVLAYLPKKDCKAAIRNLARLTRSALYITVLTEEDMEICDTDHTDMQQKLRPHAFYKKQLDKHFISLGGGLFLKKPLNFPVWRIERGE